MANTDEAPGLTETPKVTVNKEDSLFKETKPYPDMELKESDKPPEESKSSSETVASAEAVSSPESALSSEPNPTLAGSAITDIPESDTAPSAPPHDSGELEVSPASNSVVMEQVESAQREGESLNESLGQVESVVEQVDGIESAEGGDGEEETSEEKVEKPLDDDQDRRNPQYIPKGGAFYEHDNRTSLEDVENKDPQENEKKKKSWKESKESERWLHDCYIESEQIAKSTAEIMQTYGYDIRSEDAPPRARRRRKYGRGPDKYERSWEDEQAYLVKQNNLGRRGKKKSFGKDEFPPLPNQKTESGQAKSVQKSSHWKEGESRGGTNATSKPRSAHKVNGEERSPAPPSQSQHVASHPSENSSPHSNVQSAYHPSKKNYSNHVNKKMSDDDVKPFRNDTGKWKNNFKQDGPKSIKSQSIKQSDPSFKRFSDPSKGSIPKEHDVLHIADGLSQMTFHNKQANMRDIRPKSNSGHDDSKVSEPEMDSPANRQKPKRYSKIRKGYTGIFPHEEVPELDEAEIQKMQQHDQQQKSQHISMTQPLNMQNVIKRYAGPYNDFVPGSTSYLGARPIISGIPQQGMSPQGIHQQALSPQGIPQQALSPQVPGLQPIEIQQNPLAQPNFVPQPMYAMEAHYPSDVMGPYSGYPPYSGNQTGEMYQPSRGMMYYNTECQSSSQKRPPLSRRPKAAIPIVPPSE